MAPLNYGSQTLHLNSTLLLFEHFVLEINDSAGVSRVIKPTGQTDTLLPGLSEDSWGK